MVGFTRKLNTIARSTIRKLSNRPKGVYHTLRRNTLRSINKNNSRKVKVAHSENETRRRKKEKRRLRLWKAIVEEINDDIIRENIGLRIDDNGHLVATEGEVEPEQYNQLIEELEERLDSPDDEYEKKILTKAIKFVKKQRKAHLHNSQMNSLSRMMAGL